MIKEYLKSGMRNLISNKIFTVINILGLAIGLVSSLLIFTWVNNELSYDKFHTNAPQLCRLIGNDAVNSPEPLAPVLIDEFPEIINASRFRLLPQSKLEFEKTIFETRPAAIDNSFFEMFSFNFIKGDKETALQSPSSMVVSQSFASRIFGENEPLGKPVSILFYGQVMEFYVSAIVDDLPHNSHIHPECYVSIYDFVNKLYGGELSEWSDWSAVTYVQIPENIDKTGMEEKISNCVLSHTNNNSDYKVQEIQPVTKIHLSSGFKNEYADCRDIKYVYIFSVIAFFILLIACINYANNTISAAMKRLKEIGIRKVIGATRTVLIKQLSVESILVLFIASVIAFAVLSFSTPFFEDLTGSDLSFFPFEIIILFLSISIVILGIIVGIFQTTYFLSFKTITVLQARIRVPNKRISGKAILTTIQFALAIIIIIGAIGVKKQIYHVQNLDLGFEEENLVYFPLMNNSNENIQLLKNELLTNPNILSVTSGHLLTALNKQNSSSINWTGKNPEEVYYANIHRVDFDFQKTYGAEMADGRFFSEELASDKSSAFILNESAVKTFNMESPVGKNFSLWGRDGRIIGVIKDYHYETAHNMVSPAVLWMNTEVSFPKHETITMRIRPENLHNTLQFAQNIIEEHNMGYKSEYYFLDSSFENAYTAEQRFSKIMNVASLLAIFISCIGLFALITFAVRKRIKEIGIRKVNGASEITIMSILSKDIVKWVLVALVVATPVSYYVMTRWLENFAYKTTLSWWIFALAGLLTLGIALLTVSFQSWKAATRNPIEALRYE